MFDVTLAYIYRKNGKTISQEYSFQRFLKQLKDGIVQPAPTYPNRGPLPPGYLGPYLLETIEDTKVMELANLSAAQTDLDYPRVPNGIGETATASGGESGIYAVHEETEEVVSLIVWYPYEGNAWLATSWTHPDHRQKGLYRALYQRLRMECASRGMKSISCGVKGANVISQKAHEALGMEKEGVTYTGQVSVQ